MSILRDLRFLSRTSLGLWRGLRFRRLTDVKRKPAITIFGSARLPADHPFCAEAKKLSFALAEAGFSIVTGGGGSIMQAANEGAHTASGQSIGINIEIAKENILNPFVKSGHRSRYFFIRKVLLIRDSTAFVAFPGGFGTLDELFEIVTLMQTEKSGEHPIILLHSEFWRGFIDWCRNTLIPTGMISEKELARLQVVDRTEDALTILRPLIALNRL
jgi:uncharacterized protein (TIGR00730 family)